MAILQINGEQREFPDGLTIAALVAQLGMKPDRIAVELNLEIVPRTNWETTSLQNGDKLEVVHFVGGGSTSTELIQRENQAAQASASAVWQCPTCSAEAGSRFCTDCGEKKPSASDLSLRHFFTHALGDFFHFDSKIFSSFRLLFTKPGFLTAGISPRLPQTIPSSLPIVLHRQPYLFCAAALYGMVRVCGRRWMSKPIRCLTAIWLHRWWRRGSLPRA